MTQFEDITEALKRQRKNVDDSLDETSVRSAETERLLGKIEELRRRSEATTRLTGSNPQNDTGSRS